MKKIMFIGNGFDILHGLNIKFKDFISSKIFKDGIGKNYSKYFIDSEYEKFSNETELWSEFEEYCHQLTIKENIVAIKLIQKIIKLFQKWFNEKFGNIEFQKNTKLERFIIKNNVNTIISFNYTKTPEIYGFLIYYFESNSPRKDNVKEEFWKNKCIMLHAFKSDKELNMVLGHDENKYITKRKIIQKWDSNADPKELLLNSILKSKTINEIIFLGFSFGASDQKIINFTNNFLSKNDKKITIFYYKKISESITKNFKNKTKTTIKESPF